MIIRQNTIRPCDACGSTDVSMRFSASAYVPVGYGSHVEFPPGCTFYPHLRVTCNTCGYYWAMETKTNMMENKTRILDTK